MTSAYGCWSLLGEEEKKACVVAKNARLQYSFGRTLQAYRTAGKLRHEWQNLVLPQIKARTSKDDFRYAISHGKPISDCIVWTLYLVGKTPDTCSLSPTIVAECANKDLAELGCKALKKMKGGLGSLLKNYNIHYRQNVIRLTSDNENDSKVLRVSRGGSGTSLCGTQAILRSAVPNCDEEITLSTFTIGGVIVVDGAYYALIAAHAFPARGSTSSSSQDDDSDNESNNESNFHDQHLTSSPPSTSTARPSRRIKRSMTYFRSKVYAQKCDRILIGSHDLSVSGQNTDEDTLINNQS